MSVLDSWEVGLEQYTNINDLIFSGLETGPGSYASVSSELTEAE